MMLDLKQKNNGFTLVELMVATSLFTVIMLMGVGSLVVSSNSAKSAQKLRVAVDNVNFAMESMTRELRTGTYFNCGYDGVSMADGLVNDCDAGNVIAFTPQQPVDGSPVSRVAYVVRERGNGTNSLVRCEGSDDNCSEIVSLDVNVENLKFYVAGTDINPDSEATLDMIQPSAKILMSGIVKTKDGFAPFSLQSMASQRSTEQ